MKDVKRNPFRNETQKAQAAVAAGQGSVQPGLNRIATQMSKLAETNRNRDPRATKAPVDMGEFTMNTPTVRNINAVGTVEQQLARAGGSEGEQARDSDVEEVSPPPPEQPEVIDVDVD